jgi:predicted Ser/Thr protein kinase
MTPERRERVWALFDQAAELPPDARGAFLDAACAGDAGLRAEVESLLAHESGATELEEMEAFLKSPLVRAPYEPTLTPAPGLSAPSRRIGHYRIVRMLGEGGMGAVYEAEQENPRRAVALKVIRKGIASPELLKRFTHEAQILGRLRHPGIAQIYEAGLAEDGQPFFAMELIHGLPLGEYAHQHHLDAHGRLALLAKVCDAMQHAHEKGVVHRDLKLGNILVDEVGQPKVLDFGVARATDADLQSTTGRTEAGQLLGTLSYVSPEQVVADPAALDWRSDIYTLGVILFELLAGRLPYDLEHLPLPEVARVIRDREPSRLGSINGLYRGDVETIVAKALEKDKERRYASAADLAADLRRYLNQEPIRARPQSALYQLRRFARRHKALVGSVAAVMTALVAGLIGTLVFAVRAAEQRSQAEHNARVANDEKRVALYQTYRARMAAAAAAMQNHDVADAARHLADAPAELRDWEWHHLHSRLDDRSGRLAAAPGEALFLLRRPEGFRVGRFTKTSMRLTDLDGQQPRTITFNLQVTPVGFVQTRTGLWAAEAAGKEGIRLWDEAGNPPLRLPVPPEGVGISPDSTRLAVVHHDEGRVGFALYELPSGKFGGVQPGRGVDRLGGHRPHHPGVAGDGAAGGCLTARPHGGRTRGSVYPGRPAARFRQSGARRRRLGGGRHGRRLGGGFPGQPAGAARPRELRLPGGLQPGRPLDRLGQLGPHGTPVGRGDRRAVRETVEPGLCADPGLRPGRALAGDRKDRRGWPVADLGRRNGPRPPGAPGPRRVDPLSGRQPRREPDRRDVG